MGIVLDGLGPLVQQMRQRNLARISLPYRHGRVNFDVFFFIDEAPWCLLFGAKAYNLAFEVKVRPGFDADTNLTREAYKGLCEALGLTYNPANKFSPRAFLEEFGRALPSVFPAQAVVQPHELAFYRSDVEESEKIYFFGWQDNTPRGTQVSEENLYKTARLLGIAANQRCRQKNISSRWSADASTAITYTPPS